MRTWIADRVIQLERVVEGLSRGGHHRFVTRYQYDAVGNLTSVTDALGQVTRTEYDAYDRPMKTTDSLGRVTPTDYDVSGRMTGATMPDGTMMSRTTYDRLGRVVSQTNANNESTQFTYDERDQLIAARDAAGNTARYGYDEVGQQVTRVDALERVTRMTYDSSGRPGGRSATARPDELGLVPVRRAHGRDGRL